MPKAIFEAYETGNSGDGPSYAVLDVQPANVALLRKLNALCEEHKLSEVRCYDAPDAWGPGDVEEQLRFTCGELVVTRGGFWFRDQPKHADGHVETRVVSLTDFLQAVEAAAPDDVIYFGANTEELKRLYEEEEESHSPE